MTEPEENIDLHFLQLVLSLQASAMQQMGKIASPISGKVERNLDVARHSIDIISMLENKMAGNLTKEEAELLKHVLYELRLNYVDETKKDKTKKAEPETVEKGESGEEEKQAAEQEGESEKVEPDTPSNTDQ